MAENNVKMEIGGAKVEAHGEGNFCLEAAKVFMSSYVTLQRGDLMSVAVMRMRNEQVKLRDVVEGNGVDWDVVAIYDDAGIPSIMHRFRRVTNAELFGGSAKTHPAFIIGGKEYREIYISAYLNTEINGKPYSLPYMKPWVGITNDEAAQACFSKGKGWHMLTAAERGLLANTSLKLGTLPHGNTASGKYHANPEEMGTLYDSCHTLTGSGPATWTHDHKPTGVHDLCGNVCEMVRGLRIKNGFLEAAKDNDAATDIDLTAAGDNWQKITDNSGKPVRVSVDECDHITITSAEGELGNGYAGAAWKNVDIDCESERMKELALYAEEPDAYFYADSTDGEYLPICGGYWSSAASAGVFYVYLNYPRSYSGGNLGFRSAFCKL